MQKAELTMDKAREELERLEGVAQRGGDGLSEKDMVAAFISFTRTVLKAAKSATKQLHHQREDLTRLRKEMIGLQNTVLFKHPEAVEEQHAEELLEAEEEALERLREGTLVLELFERGLEQQRELIRESGALGGGDDGDDGDIERMLRSQIDDLDNRLQKARYRLGETGKQQDLLLAAEGQLRALEEQLQQTRKRHAELQQALDECRRKKGHTTVVRIAAPPPPSPPSTPSPTPSQPAFPTREAMEEGSETSSLPMESLINMTMTGGSRASLVALVDESLRFLLDAEKQLENVEDKAGTDGISADEARTLLTSLGRQIVEFVDSTHQEMDVRSLTLLEIRNEIREMEQLYAMTLQLEAEEEHLQLLTENTEHDALERMRNDMYEMAHLSQRLQERRDALREKGGENVDDGDECDDAWQLRNDIQVREVRLMAMETREKMQGDTQEEGDAMPQEAVTFEDSEISEANTELLNEKEQADYLQKKLDECLKDLAPDGSTAK